MPKQKKIRKQMEPKYQREPSLSELKTPPSRLRMRSQPPSKRTLTSITSLEPSKAQLSAGSSLTVRDMLTTVLLKKTARVTQMMRVTKLALTLSTS